MFVHTNSEDRSEWVDAQVVVLVLLCSGWALIFFLSMVFLREATEMTKKEDKFLEEWSCKCITFKSRHDKANKMSVRPAKTKISLGIRPV